MLEYIAAAPQGVSGYLESALDSVGESLYKLPAALSQWGLELVARTAQASPDTLLFAVTAGIGTYFASASYPQLTAFLAAQIPAGLRRRFSGVGGNLKGSFGGWLRAQLILMLMTFFELLIGFLLLRVRGAPVIAAVTALVDALPVFGTGTVLLPWAAACLLLGQAPRAVALAALYAVISAVRSFLEPKVMAAQAGLPPLAALAAMYAGFRAFGVAGMILLPVALLFVKQLHDQGYVGLWK